MIKDNYNNENSKPIDYIIENIQESDMIVYGDFGGGSVVAAYFPENQVYFYNKDNWGVEEAYKAFGPNYEVKVTKDFIQECSNRIWVVDNAYGNVVEELFENTDYKIISEKEFFTKYHDYSYKITLVEK